MNNCFKLTFLFLVLAGITGFSIAGEKNRIDSLRTLLSTEKEPIKKLKILLQLNSEFKNSQVDSSMYYAVEARKIAEENNLKNELSVTIVRMGIASFKNGHTAKALEFYNEALEISLKNNDLNGQALAYNNIGGYYYNKGEYNKALDNFLKNIKAGENLPDAKEWLPTILLNIGSIYFHFKEYDKSLEYYQKALSAFSEIDDQQGIALSLGNIANIYTEKKDYHNSIDYHKKSIDIFKKVGDSKALITAYNNLGQLLTQSNEYEEALKNFLFVLEESEKLQEKTMIAIALISLSDVYMTLGKYAKSEEYGLRALELFKLMGAKKYISANYLHLAGLYRKMKELDKSINYYEKHIALQDSIFNQENFEQIAEMEALYESEKNLSEIELLKKDTEIKNLQLNKNRAWMLGLTASLILLFSLAGFSYNGYRTKKKANNLLLLQNEEISHQKKEITDSINYAKKIQEAILPPHISVKTLLPDSFILYKPKDIVSGDFYWLEAQTDKDESLVLLAAVDCTGHGVPGALMSVIGLNLLNQAVHEKKLSTPSLILQHLDWGVNDTLRQSDLNNTVKDGMDLGLCAINLKTGKVQYAGAYNPLYYIHKGEFFEIKADKSPIGVNVDGIVDEYTNNEVQLEKGDCIYLLSDGYADQFGGPKGKKFKYRALKELLLAIHKKEMEEQKAILDQTVEQWRGDLEQVDDMLLIGVRI